VSFIFRPSCSPYTGWFTNHNKYRPFPPLLHAGPSGTFLHYLSVAHFLKSSTTTQAVPKESLQFPAVLTGVLSTPPGSPAVTTYGQLFDHLKHLPPAELTTERDSSHLTLASVSSIFNHHLPTTQLPLIFAPSILPTKTLSSPNLLVLCYGLNY